MTNNPTIDGVSRELRALLERIVKGGDILDSSVAMHELRALLDAPSNDLREHCKKCAEVVKTWPEWKQNCLGGAPAKCGQCGSTSADICNQNGCGFLESGNGAPAVERQEMPFPGYPPVPDDRKIPPPEVAALQSTIAQLQARIAELESGRGEPVAWMYHERAEDGHEYRPLFSQAKWSVLPEGFYKESPLYTAPPAPVAVVLPERKPEPSCMTALDDDREAAIWNECLDATAALNEVRK